MENPLRGILCLLGATIFFSCSDAMAKYITQFLPVIEVLWIRYGIFILLAAGIVIGSRQRRLRVRSPVIQIARGLGLLGSGVFFIYGLRILPMADAAAINFMSPLLITLLAVPVLGERVGLHRWIAIALGVLGVLIVVRPGAGTFNPGAGVVILSAFSWAGASVLTRKLAATDHAATTLLWSACSGWVVLTVLLFVEFRMPTLRQFGICLAIGIVASTGQYFLVLAYREAAASLLAPFSYAQLIWSPALGYLVFAAIPDRWTLLGGVVIMLSGLYAANSERLRARAPTPLPTPRRPA